jgi:hypothetical protein
VKLAIESYQPMGENSQKMYHIFNTILVWVKKK